MLSQDTGFMASINAYEYTDNRYNRSVEKRFSVQGATKYILSGSARDRVSQIKSLRAAALMYCICIDCAGKRGSMCMVKVSPGTPILHNTAEWSCSSACLSVSHIRLGAKKTVEYRHILNSVHVFCQTETIHQKHRTSTLPSNVTIVKKNVNEISSYL